MALPGSGEEENDGRKARTVPKVASLYESEGVEQTSLKMICYDGCSLQQRVLHTIGHDWYS